MSSFVNGFIVFSLLITIGFFVGVVVFITDHEEKNCEMTYMFEYPQFVRISHKIDSKHKKYALYAYSEGQLTERARDIYFDGIPVLFIPGNAGSYRQVRSLASIALRKSLNSRLPYHFDYFTVDLNDELNGLNGQLLFDHLEYVNSSVYRVLELYKTRYNGPKSIILFGHSMGGIIAYKFVSDLPPYSNLVSIVLTLATSFRRAPLVLDSYLDSFYKEIKFNHSSPASATFISVSGGYNDLLVLPQLTNLQDNHSLSVVSTHVPRSWLAVDHLCILWCKQLVMAMNRALFDSVDPKTKQISSEPDFRKAVFHHHLVHHSGTNVHLRKTYGNSAKHLRNDGKWIEYLARQYTITLDRGTNEALWYMVKLVDMPQHEFLTVIALNMESHDWIYVCGAHIPRGNSRVCEEFYHLTHLSEISPSARYKRRSLRINLHELMRNNSILTHVVVRVLPTEEPVILQFDVHAVNERKLQVTLPHLLSLKSVEIMESTPEKIVNLELVLSQLLHVIQSYQLNVEVVKCPHEFRHATVSLIVPWANQNHHKHFTETDSKSFNVRLYQSRPQSSNDSAFVRLSLDPNCQYRLSIRSSIPGVLGQLARFYSPLLIVNVAAVIMMALNAQLKSLGANQHCSLLFTAIKEGAKPYYILTAVKLISRLHTSNGLGRLIAPPDWKFLAEDGTDFFFLPLLLYVCSVGIVWLLGIGLGGSLVAFETTIHKFALKFLARTVSFNVALSDYVMSALQKVPLVVVGVLITLTFSTTGALALGVGMVFYFLKLTQMSQDFIEELVWFYFNKLRRKFGRKVNTNVVEKKDESGDLESTQNSMFFHATIFMLWTLVTLINVPSLLTWAHNFKFDTVLQPDPAFIPGLALSLCAFPLWHLDLPKVERRWYTEVGQFVIVLAVLSLIYAPISIFRLNYTITTAIVTVTLHQLIAKNREDLINAENTENPDESSQLHEKYDSVKTKLE